MTDKNNQSVLGFDFGMKSIGVAIAQSVTGTAAPLQAIKGVNGIPDWDIIVALYDEWKPDAIVVGVPLNMDGTSQHTTFAARKFANRVQQKLKHQVFTHDERLTTVEAKARLFELGGVKKLTKGKVDSVSACLIIEHWLESQ